MDLDADDIAFAGIKDAFPLAKCNKEGVISSEMPNPSIAAIRMKTACIKNERIQFTTYQGEFVDLRLLCRENLTVSTSPVELFLRASVEDDALDDVALLKFQNRKGYATCHHAVCIGLILSK